LSVAAFNDIGTGCRYDCALFDPYPLNCRESNSEGLVISAKCLVIEDTTPPQSLL